MQSRAFTDLRCTAIKIRLLTNIFNGDHNKAADQCWNCIYIIFPPDQVDFSSSSNRFFLIINWISPPHEMDLFSSSNGYFLIKIGFFLIIKQIFPQQISNSPNPIFTIWKMDRGRGQEGGNLYPCSSTGKKIWEQRGRGRGGNSLTLVATGTDQRCKNLLPQKSLGKCLE